MSAASGLRKPNGTQEREAERFRLAWEKQERAERRLRRAMLAWLRAKDALNAMEKRAGRKPTTRIGGEYDPRDLVDHKGLR